MKFTAKQLDEKLVELIKQSRRYIEEHRDREASHNSLDDNGIREALGRKWKVVAGNLVKLAEHIESNYTSRHFQLSQKNPAIVELLGTHQNASKTIKAAVKVGLLSCVDDQYTFGLIPEFDGARNKAKTYAYNSPVKDQLEHLLDPSYFFTPSANRCTYIPSSSSSPQRSLRDPLEGYLKDFRSNTGKFLENTQKLLEAVGRYPRNYNYRARIWEVPRDSRPCFRFASRMNVSSIDGDSMVEKQNTVLQALEGVYSELEVFRSRMIADASCKRLPDPFLCKMEPKLTWSRPKDRSATPKLTKIGIRATSPFCNTTNHGGFRERWLKNNGWESVHGHDVHSSIFRVNFFLNYGIWLPNSIDLYDLMRPGDCALPREIYKLLAYRLYFTASPSDAYNKLVWDIPKEERERMAANGTRDAIIDRLGKYARSMENIIGPGYDNEIFLHESCIYYRLSSALVDAGLAVATVYDCFYSDYEGIARVVEELLPTVAGYYSGWLGWTPLEVPPTTVVLIEQYAERKNLNTTIAMKKTVKTPETVEEKIVTAPYTRPAPREPEAPKAPVETPDELKGTWLDGVDMEWFNGFLDGMLIDLEQYQLLAIKNALDAGRAREAKTALDSMRIPVENARYSPTYHEVDREVVVDGKGYRTTTIYYSNGGRTQTVDAPGWERREEKVLHI